MAFPLSHWKNPRQTIACMYKNNDIEYATHGAMQSLIALSHLDYKMGDFRNMTILDYGCGTGRMARPLASVFKTVYAYDPVVECIELGKTECGMMKFNNLVLTANFDDIPEVDIAYSVNVIEHLTDADADVMISNLKSRVRGDTVLWYSIAKNSKVLRPFLSKEQSEEDARVLQHSNQTIQIAQFKFKQPY